MLYKTARIQAMTVVALVTALCLGGPARAQSGLSASTTPGAQEVAHDQSDSSCNAALIGAILKPRLGIDFGVDGGNGDVIQFVCKTHPSRPGQTIVALFHELKDEPRGTEQEKTGVVVAVIDARRRLLHSLHQETIADEAIIRVRSGSLSIDTARYNLAPGVRAFGVRMNIGYSPRYADGGQDGYLTLFVEEGKQLVPVLSAFPMHSWTVKEGTHTCDDGEDGCREIVNTELALALSTTFNGGWRDLDVIAQDTQEMGTPDGGSAAARIGPPRVIAKLRKQGKQYQPITAP